MAMDPKTHPRGKRPDFSMAGLPANPSPQRITAALWWLRCMRLRLEPLSADGGIVAAKPGYHSWGSRLPGAGAGGAGKASTDHSIRRAPDRSGQWWMQYASAHDWTFTRAHSGNHTEINKYMKRRIDAMRSLTDLRPDDVYAYTIGQLDGDDHIEGWNEYRDAEETGDDSHDWHIHDAFRRNIIGNFWAMWKALTIDMGWTYAEWLRSVGPQEDDDMDQTEFTKLFKAALADPAIAATMRSLPWQYAGRGIADNDLTAEGNISTLGALDTILRSVKDGAELDVSELAQIQMASKAGTTEALAGLSEQIAVSIKAALPPDLLDEDELTEAVEAGVRGAFERGLAPETPA